jgi:hypothetical protein
LYTPADGEGFDQDHNVNIQEEFNNYVMSCPTENDMIMTDLITNVEVNVAIKSLKYGKAGGFDNLSNEHVKHGGHRLVQVVSLLFNKMYELGKIPNDMKKGMVVTIHKGTQKYKDDRKNHRGITLLPVMYKLLEKIISQRIQCWIDETNVTFPCPSQHGYQRSVCSVMTSFTLQECIHYNTERGSPVFVCFLDSATAFDTVWHTGLFVKLHRLGIKGKLWSLLINAYTNMTNCVLHNGVRSDWIDVKQSVR